MTTDNAQELGRAIESKQNEITVEGDLAKKIIRIKTTGKVAWVIAGGAIAIGVIAVMKMPVAASTGPTGLIAEGLVLGTTAAGAVSVLGVSATVTAVSIGVGARNKRALDELRNNYTLTIVNDRKIILRHK